VDRRDHLACPASRASPGISGLARGWRARNPGKLENPRSFCDVWRVDRIPTHPRDEGFRVNPTINQRLRNGKRRIERRLDPTDLRGCAEPMYPGKLENPRPQTRARREESGPGACRNLALLPPEKQCGTGKVCPHRSQPSRPSGPRFLACLRTR
jgi:hypothetical protein